VPILAAVVAHPDDDTFAISGTVAIHAHDPAFRFVLIHATSGENGPIAHPSLASRETLGAVREQESSRSWARVGRTPDRCERLRYPDGKVELVPMDDLVGAIAGILQDERPDVVVTFGPDGVTRNPDHVRVGEATTIAFHRLRSTSDGGFRRLLYLSIDRRRLDEYDRRMVSIGEAAIDPNEPLVPVGVAADRIGVDVDCRAVIDRRRAALLAHETQAKDFSEHSPYMAEEIIGWESYVVAWPERPGDPSRMGGVFQDLD
jgi:LmbE family N-acetylglucosaminyl deacetylase